MIGCVLAAGYSTRLKSLGIGQKASVKVRWNGKVLPAVVHQIDLLNNVGIEEIVVMYGWKGDEVISAVRQNERNVLFLEDRFIRGQAMAWKQLVDAFGSNVKFVSVNVDDLHLAKEIERIKDIKEGVSVKRVSGYRSLNKYTAYDVVGGSLAGVYRSGCIFGVDWYLGTGIYVLNGGCIKYMEEDKEKSEYTADNLINNMIAGGRILKAYEVVTWHDIGNVEGMRKVIEDDRFRI